MRSTLAIASLLSLSTFAVAQNYGRFPCTIVNGDGTFSPGTFLLFRIETTQYDR